MQKSSGHTLSEYGFVGALIAITCLGSLAMLGHSMQGQYQQISHAPDPTDLLKPIAQPAVAASPAAQSGFTLPAASSNTVPTGISDYKAVASSVQTAGANGTTKILADNLVKLAQDELAAGKITEVQSNLIIQLANQAYHMADIEKVIETAVSKSKLTGSAFADQIVTLDGQETTIYDLHHGLGFVQDYNVGLLPNPLESMSLAGSKMQEFLSLYQQVEASGALSDQAVHAQVQNYSSQIATIADAFVFATEDRTASTRSVVNLSDNMANRLSDYSASQATNENGNGICTTGNGNVYTGKGNHCSG